MKLFLLTRYNKLYQEVSSFGFLCLRLNYSILSTKSSFIKTKLEESLNNTKAAEELYQQLKTENYILQVCKIEFNYCSHNADSRGLIEYLKRDLIALAKNHPTIEFLIRPKFSRAAVIHVNGKERCINVSNLTTQQIRQKIMLLRDNNGEKADRFREKVLSKNPAIRPIWNPWHNTKLSPLDGSEDAWRRQLRIERANVKSKIKTSRQQLFDLHSAKSQKTS